MFESAELGHKVDKATYERELPELREALLDVQYELALTARFPVLILIGGVDGAGKGETINVLNSWMDPRHIETHAYSEPTEEERERPPMWRFWRVLPPEGRVGVFMVGREGGLTHGRMCRAVSVGKPDFPVRSSPGDPPRCGFAGVQERADAAPRRLAGTCLSA